MKKLLLIICLLSISYTQDCFSAVVARPFVNTGGAFFFGGFGSRGWGWGGYGGGYNAGGFAQIGDGGSYDPKNYELYYPYHADNFLYDECPDDQPVGRCSEDGCWELYVHYEPYFYKDCHCVKECTPYFIEKCEYVTKYYDVDRYRYVPQWSVEKICRIVPEYRCEDPEVTGSSGPECHCVKKYFEVARCRQVPERYTETICRREPVYWYETVWKEHERLCSKTRCRCIPNYYWKYIGEPCDIFTN